MSNFFAARGKRSNSRFASSSSSLKSMAPKSKKASAFADSSSSGGNGKTTICGERDGRVFSPEDQVDSFARRVDCVPRAHALYDVVVFFV